MPEKSFARFFLAMYLLASFAVGNLIYIIDKRGCTVSAPLAYIGLSILWPLTTGVIGFMTLVGNMDNVRPSGCERVVP